MNISIPMERYIRIEMAAGGFVSRAFESMLKECSGKKYPDLQKAIQAYIVCMNLKMKLQKLEHNQISCKLLLRHLMGSQCAEMENITIALANAGCTLDEADVEIVLNPLCLAFETKNLKILEPALDCIHKLIAYDHLEGDPGLEGGKNVPLFTDILNMVCSCVDNSSPDSTILQVLKVLLTAVASAKFRVRNEVALFWDSKGV
ncbi:hypothetical protein GH714_037839 [Hevea brasiliensis]|uniref:Mon2/Sec7/BIG1-like dimerisation and cyclophilin-binding domain-containing protein n=1 Tax=Hevea brasiliensis TaxID=3981 RepID=A0A6A6K8E8_HEVBR|nr:hypothetical protein GH714_037839 [Hevea brasiliensis]